MAEITAAAVKALREKTDLPMMECKKALTEAGGDEQKAIAILKEMFKKVQEKRADSQLLWPLAKCCRSLARRWWTSCWLVRALPIRPR